MLTLVAGAAILAAQAGPAAGDWVLKMQSPQGELEFKFTLAADGKATFENPRLKVEKSAVEGKSLKMTIKRERADGSAAMTYDMKATIDGDTMTGTAETDMGGTPANMEWSAKKAK
ncbi:MAG: hypothetical protein K2X35_08390 [Bryobacteraceae bacterium]|nr:hypothetical protein [Bryobacteraceae bacterium]